VAARELLVDEYQVVKTLVMEDDRKTPFLVIMHGNRQVSTKNMARVLGVKSVIACDPKVGDQENASRVCRGDDSRSPEDFHQRR
jgi:prolyl-tRNA editing enzyme YbaK/EbsC (Cys-tRNA(Pro) deacylase)